MSDPEDPGGEPYTVWVTDEQDLPVEEAPLRHVATTALRTIGFPPGSELSIALVSPEVIADLKGRYYGEAAATDVLSFPMDGLDGPVIGDVVICAAVARRQARGLGRTFGEEMALLLVHGVLHLAGRDHATPADEVAMRREEQRILQEAVAS